MALIFATYGISLGAAAASFTITHALGTTPDFVYITSAALTGTSLANLLSSTSQIILVSTQIGTALVCNVEVVKHHSITY